MHSVHNSNQFLSYFNKIDKYLSSVLGIKKYMSYNEKIDLVIQKKLQWSQVVDQYQSKFLYFGELRNQLVHGFSLDQKHFIVVSDHAVLQIKSLYDGLITPKTVWKVFVWEVYCCEVTDSLGEVITIMKEKLNTHVPVYSDWEFIEMLSESTIAYWLADQIIWWEVLDVQNLVVWDVSLENSNDTFIFVAWSESIYEVKEYFTQEFANKKRLGAVFITATWNKNEPILGIITAMDFHYMIEMWSLLSVT